MASPSDAEGTAGKREKPASPTLVLSKFLVWWAASAGALSIICTVFGFLVKHAYLDRLGVPRTAYEASPTEYIATGAKFLAGVIPLAIIGSIDFVTMYWWMTLLIVLFAAAIWKWRLASVTRLAIAAALYAVWWCAMLLRFDRVEQQDQHGLAIFSFGTLIGLLYCCIEVFLAAYSGAGTSVAQFLARLPMFALVFCSVFALPYIKGAYGVEHDNPMIRFLGDDAAYFCKLAGADPASGDCGAWELIELGKERALLRKPPDSAIYVVPVSSMKTFQLTKAEGQK